MSLNFNNAMKDYSLEPRGSQRMLPIQVINGKTYIEGSMTVKKDCENQIVAFKERNGRANFLLTCHNNSVLYEVQPGDWLGVYGKGSLKSFHIDSIQDGHLIATLADALYYG